MSRATLVIGASINPDRYAYKAIISLVNHKQKVYALGLKAGEVGGIVFDTEKIQYKDIDTVTLYVGPQNQAVYYDYIASLNPRRVIFNPGTENDEFEKRLQAQGIAAVENCTLVLLSTGQY